MIGDLKAIGWLAFFALGFSLVVWGLAVASGPQEVLDDYAQDHSETMADAGGIWHSDLTPLLVVCPGGVAENVGVGGSIESLDAAFLASPPHAANLLADWDYIARGITWANGRVYIADVFCDAALVQGGNPSPWAAGVWKRATDAGIVNGERPRDSISREEVVAILCDRLGEC